MDILYNINLHPCWGTKETSPTWSSPTARILTLPHLCHLFSPSAISSTLPYKLKYTQYIKWKNI